jgi:biopolymer transport protein TolR
MSGRRREVNFELDLLPVISILAVCICFLLFVVSWTPLGVMKTEQAFGEGSSKGTENPASIFAMIKDGGELDLTLKDAPIAAKALIHQSIQGIGGKVNTAELETYLSAMKQQLPELKVAVVMPHHSSDVDEVMQVMDQFRKKQFSDVGVSPF